MGRAGRAEGGDPGAASYTAPASDCKERKGKKRLGTKERPALRSAHDFLTAPELSEEFLHGGRECAIIESVDDVLALPLVEDQVGLFEDREVARNGRLRQVEVPDDLPHRVLAVFQQTEDFLPSAVRQCFEDLRQVPFVPPKALHPAVDVGHDVVSSFVTW